VLVLLADHPRAVRRVEELLLDLRLDQRSLLLDDHNRVEASGKSGYTARLERPNHSDLVEPNAELVRLHLVDAQLVEGLAHVEIALARGDDTEPGCWATAHDYAVELVGACERQHCGALEIVQSRL